MYLRGAAEICNRIAIPLKNGDGGVGDFNLAMGLQSHGKMAMGLQSHGVSLHFWPPASQPEIPATRGSRLEIKQEEGWILILHGRGKGDFFNVDHVGQDRSTKQKSTGALGVLRGVGVVMSMRAVERTSVNRMLRRWAGGIFFTGGCLGLGWWEGIDSAHQGPPICHTSIHMGAAALVGLGGLGH